MTGPADRITAVPLTSHAFAPFGDVLEAVGAPNRVINQGKCGRYHDLARMHFTDGRAGISLFSAEPRQLPCTLDMMERHPLGSQAFIPMSWTSFLVVVAADRSGTPDTPLAFLTRPGQSVNLHANTWHGVLCPLEAPGLFAVVDRIGGAGNLQEHWFDAPYVVASATPSDA